MATTTLRRTAVALTAAIALGGLTACGGDDGDGQTDDQASGSEETQHSDSGGDDASEDGGTDDAGSPDDGDGIELSVDVCSLGAEALPAFLDPQGGEVTPEEDPEPMGFGPSCVWTGPLGSELTVSVSGYDDWMAIEDLEAMQEEGSIFAPPQPIPGLGDEAWASEDPPSLAQVAWRRDDISVHLRGDVSSAEGPLADVAGAIDADLRAAGH